MPYSTNPSPCWQMCSRRLLIITPITIVQNIDAHAAVPCTERRLSSGVYIISVSPTNTRAKGALAEHQIYSMHRMGTVSADPFHAKLLSHCCGLFTRVPINVSSNTVHLFRPKSALPVIGRRQQHGFHVAYQHEQLCSKV